MGGTYPLNIIHHSLSILVFPRGDDR
jgi:hypothetical protein